MLLALIIYFLFSSLYFNYLTITPKEKFDELIWSKSVTERHKMIDDLLSSNYLIGKSKNKIKEIFGKPSKSFEKENTWNYELVKRNWSDFETVYLKIYFENNAVSKFDSSTRQTDN